MPFNGTSKEEEAFNVVKDTLRRPLFLARRKLQLLMLVSQSRISRVLLQWYADGTEKAVFHMSKALSSSQKNYRQIEKELFCLVIAVKRFYKYI